MNKKAILTATSFGSRVAEDESDELSSYFVETEQWRKIIAGDVDIIYGPKGSGKSALYSLLVKQEEKLRLGQRTVIIAAENPRGTPAFRDLAQDPPTSEEEFKGLWKLYFLTVLANYLRRHYEVSKTSDPNATEAINILAENGLLARNLNLIGILKAALDYLRHRVPSVEASVTTDPITGNTIVAGKIMLSEPSIEQQKHGFISVDALFQKLNEALVNSRITVWLVLDRLDVAFTDSSTLERNALRSLFRVYLDLNSLTKISLKIFLRDDIWRKLLSEGFREASHITRSLTISWDSQSLLNLIVRRLIHNSNVCTLYSVNKNDILQDAALQSELFYRVFPVQVDIGQKKLKTLEWMLSRTADASRRAAPRELIHLLAIARDEQLKLYELGNPDPPLENLFDRSAIKAALPTVSKTRFEQTLCAEHPTLKPYLDKLEGEKTQQTLDSLARLWRIPRDKTNEIADQLTEVGFFERKGTKDNPIYWVPFIYRDSLHMVQGGAEFRS